MYEAKCMQVIYMQVKYKKYKTNFNVTIKQLLIKNKTIKLT